MRIDHAWSCFEASKLFMQSGTKRIKEPFVFYLCKTFRCIHSLILLFPPWSKETINEQSLPNIRKHLRTKSIVRSGQLGTSPHIQLLFKSYVQDIDEDNPYVVTLAPRIEVRISKSHLKDPSPMFYEPLTQTSHLAVTNLLRTPHKRILVLIKLI
jgi:hypothetical protein